MPANFCEENKLHYGGERENRKFNQTKTSLQQTNLSQSNKGRDLITEILLVSTCTTGKV